MVRYFKGSSKVEKMVIRGNKNKIEPSPKSIDMLLHLNRLDVEFYRLVLHEWTDTCFVGSGWILSCTYRIGYD